MSVQEKEPLIQSAGKDNGEENGESNIKCRHFVLVPIGLVMYFAYGMSYYGINQWIQHYVSMELFPNMTVDSSANDGCTAKNHSDPDYIAFQRVEQSTARWQMVYSVSATFTSFLASTVLSSYSDRYGRRALFITGVAGLMIKTATFTIIVYYKMSLVYLVVAVAIEGVTGSYYSATAAAYAYIADITVPGRQRTIGITVYDAIMLISMTIATLGSGFFLKYFGFFITLATCAVLAAVTLFLVIFFVQETLGQKLRSNALSVCSNFRRTIEFYSSSEFKGRRCAYLLLISAYFVEECTISRRAAIEMIYQLGMPFCWNSEKIGYFASARLAGQGLLGMLFVVPMKKVFSELQIAIFSTMSNTGAFVMEAFARTDLVLYLVPVVSTWSFLTVPMVKSIMSSMTSPDKQGSLFASITAIQSVSGIIASFAFNSVYAATIHIMNGFVFLVLAAVCMVVFFILVVFSFTQPPSKTSQSGTDQEKVVP